MTSSPSLSGYGVTWVSWTPNALNAFDGTNRYRIDHAVPADWRYYITIRRAGPDTLWLKSADAQRTVVDKIVGGARIPLEVPGVLAELPPYRVIIPGSDLVAGIPPENDSLVLWQPTGPVRTSSIPGGFHVRDVVREPNGKLWICGSTAQTRLRSLETRKAYAWSNDTGQSWIVGPEPRAGLVGAWRGLLSGAEAEYRHVFALNGFLVLSADLGESSAVYVRYPTGKWRMDVVNDVLRSLLSTAQGGVMLVFHYGTTLSVGPPEDWKRGDVRWLLSLDAPDASTQYQVISAVPNSGGRAALVVSLRTGRDGEMARSGEMVVVVGGSEPFVAARSTPDEPEIISAAL